MTIDEAIKLCEQGSKRTWNGRLTIYAEQCQQMVEWLKELKIYREAGDKKQEENNNEQMTVEEYRQRLIQAFCNADWVELIAVCVFPTEKEFKHLEWLLKNHYKKQLWLLKNYYKEQLCDDAVSRQEVLDLIADYDLTMGQVVNGIHALQTVTLQPKMGQWNLTKHYGRDYYACSFCGMEYMYDHSSGWNYCPNCGCKCSNNDAK